MAALTCVASNSAQAQTATEVQISASQDNSLFQEGDLSNGAGQYLFTGRIASGARRRALLRFDLAPIPANAIIQSVRLEMFMSRTIAGATTVDLHRATADWGEAGSDAPGQEGTGTAALPGDATWTHRFFSTTPWTTPGGDYLPTPSASASVVDIGTYTWSSPSMVADLESWRSIGNFGWVIIGNENVPTTAKRFDSRESPTAANRPRLVVSYTPGSAPPGGAMGIPSTTPWGLLALGLLLAAIARRRLLATGIR